MPVIKDPEARQRRRSGGILAGAIMLTIITTQAFTLHQPIDVGHPRAVDLVRTGAFVMLIIVLALRSTSAFSLLRKDPELDDELARAHRADASRRGYWALVVVSLAALLASMFFELTVLEVMPSVLMFGVFVSAVRFAQLERRALKNA
jgi:hypothetical protein